MFLNQGFLVINKIFSILKEFERQINSKNKELIALLKSDIYCAESEKKIERLATVTFNSQIMMDINNQINILFDKSLLDISKYALSFENASAVKHNKNLKIDYIIVPGPRVKYRREKHKIPNFGEFQYIAKFSKTESSLYQALSVGLSEIFIWFQLSNDIIEPLRKNFEDQKAKALTFAKDTELDRYVKGLIEIITNITKKAPDRMTSFQWLSSYSETEESMTNLSMDYGMRVLICSILRGNAKVHQRILRDEITDEDIGSIFYAISSMGMQITVFNGQTISNHVKYEPDKYPVIYLNQSGRNFSLIYTMKMIEIETNPNFSNTDVEKYPFMVDTGIASVNSRNQQVSLLKGLQNTHIKGAAPQGFSTVLENQTKNKEINTEIKNPSNAQEINAKFPNIAPSNTENPSFQTPKPEPSQEAPNNKFPSESHNPISNPSILINQGSQNFALPFQNTKLVLSNKEPSNLPAPKAENLQIIKNSLNLINQNLPAPDTSGRPNLWNTMVNIPTPNSASPESSPSTISVYNLRRGSFQNSVNWINSNQPTPNAPSFNTVDSINQQKSNIPKQTSPPAMLIPKQTSHPEMLNLMNKNSGLPGQVPNNPNPSAMPGPAFPSNPKLPEPGLNSKQLTPNFFPTSKTGDPINQQNSNIPKQASPPAMLNLMNKNSGIPGQVPYNPNPSAMPNPTFPNNPKFPEPGMNSNPQGVSPRNININPQGNNLNMAFHPQGFEPGNISTQDGKSNKSAPVQQRVDSQSKKEKDGDKKDCSIY